MTSKNNNFFAASKKDEEIQPFEVPAFAVLPTGADGFVLHLRQI